MSVHKVIKLHSISSYRPFADFVSTLQVLCLIGTNIRCIPPSIGRTGQIVFLEKAMCAK